MEVSKKDRRICRELIHRALEKECERFVKSTRRLASKPIPLAELNEPYREDNGQSVEGPWHKIYIQIFKRVYNYDRHVGHRTTTATAAIGLMLSRNSTWINLSPRGSETFRPAPAGSF